MLQRLLHPTLAFLTCLGALPLALHGAEMVANEEGVYGYDDTPYLPWIHYRTHDHSRPKPPPRRSEACHHRGSGRCRDPF